MRGFHSYQKTFFFFTAAIKIADNVLRLHRFEKKPNTATVMSVVLQHFSVGKINAKSEVY